MRTRKQRHPSQRRGFPHIGIPWQTGGLGSNPLRLNGAFSAPRDRRLERNLLAIRQKGASTLGSLERGEPWLPRQGSEEGEKWPDLRLLPGRPGNFT